jgi:hypothetical protein
MGVTSVTKEVALVTTALKYRSYDKQEFWLISATRGFPSDVLTCQWTTPGSFDLIRNHISTPS